MSKVFAQSVRAALLLVDPVDGTKAHRIPNAARQTLLRNDLVDIADGDEVSTIVLTKVGRFAQEILVELGEAWATCDRMKEIGLASVLAPLQHQGRAGAIPFHRTLGGEPRPALTCGTLNHDSFATFIASLNAAGKNRWRDPSFQGERPVRSSQPEGEE